MSSKLVSIALCTYNGAVYLRQQLDTLISQTYSNIEIIAVDDRSTDGTIEILKEYSVKHQQIKLYLNQENVGYIANFEKATGLCNGDYIALADQDDIWDMRKISIMVDSIGEHLLIYHDSEFIDDAGQQLHKKISDIRNCYSGSDSRVFLFENCISGHAVLFKRELLSFTDGFRKTIIHDWWLGYAATNNGRIYFLNQVLVQYRQHQQANTNILRQERSNVVKENSLDKIDRQQEITKVFVSYPFNRDLAFKTKLAELMKRRMNSYFSFSLAWFVFRHRHILLFIQKKSAFSKFNFIVKLIWGYQLKKLM